MELGSKKRDKPGLRLIRVDPPRLGERVPSQVIAEIVLDLHSCGKLEFSLLFLVRFDVHNFTHRFPFIKQLHCSKNGVRLESLTTSFWLVSMPHR